MKLWQCLCLDFLAFIAGVIVGRYRERQRIERIQKEQQRIDRDYPDSVERDYKAGPA